jgi:UDP-N-acetylglucosamine 2-epimerase (non-hydrolysing)
MKVLSRDELSKKICVVLGTRPGIIKMSPIIRKLQLQRSEFFIVHSGQHYSKSMDSQFFEDLNLPQPEYHIEDLESVYSHGQQTAKMLIGVEKALLAEKPAVTLVGGDANTNLAGGLASRKLGISLGHVEAGLRSGDWRMPEEHNRVILDHISDYLFAPTEQSRNNLLKDNVRGKVFVVGNTVADAIEQNVMIAKQKRDTLHRQNLTSKNYILMTVHREENVDNISNLRRLVECLESLAELIDMPIIFPMHPRTEKRIKEFGLSFPKNVILTQPFGYLDFLNLITNARMVITDSGGLQEESCILGVPCVTVRDSTERPETVEAGANIVSGLDRKIFIKSCKIQLENKNRWANPFPSGASSKIVGILRNELLLA